MWTTVCVPASPGAGGGTFSTGVVLGFWGIFLVPAGVAAGGETGFWPASCAFPCVGGGAGGRVGEPPKKIMATRISQNKPLR